MTPGTRNGKQERAECAVNNNLPLMPHNNYRSAVCPSPRIASLSKIFPTLMLYKLWEDGKIGSLDDPLEKYVENFTIKNPLGKTRESQLKYVTDGLIFLDSGEVQIRSSSVTLRRMASQLSGAFGGGAGRDYTKQVPNPTEPR